MKTHSEYLYMYIQWEMPNALYMRWTTRHKMAVLKQEMHFPSHNPSVWKQDGVHFQRIINIISSASITLKSTSTSITPDITKTQSNNCFIKHCFQENNDKHSVARNTVSHWSWKLCIARWPWSVVYLANNYSVGCADFQVGSWENTDSENNV